MQTLPPAREHLFRILIRALGDFVLVLGSDEKVRAFWSSKRDLAHAPNARPFLGWLNDLLRKETLAWSSERFPPTKTANRSRAFEYGIECPGGSRWYVVRLMPGVASERGAWRRTIVISAQDVTDCKVAHNHLVQSREQLTQILDCISDPIFVKDQDHRLVYINKAECEMAGVPRQDMLGRTDYDFFPKQQVDIFWKQDDWVLQTGLESINEEEITTATGNVHTVVTKKTLLMGLDGSRHIVGVIRDITARKHAEARLRQSESLLAQAEQIADFGSWEFDLKTRTATLSKHLRQIYNLSPEADWSETLYWESLHPEDRERARHVWKRAIAARKPFQLLTRSRTPCGSYRTYLLRGLPLRGKDGKVARVTGVAQDVTERIRAEEEHRQLSHQLIRARDQERRQLARELHETAGQSLAALKMSLGHLKDALCDSSALARRSLQTCLQLAEEAIRDVRTVSYLMHPSLLDDVGLDSALRWYAKGFAERSGIQVTTELPDACGQLPHEIQTAVFRIVQEALTNVHRYSGSRTARILLTKETRGIRVEIQDDGCGLPLPAAGPGGLVATGVGIAGMRERVTQLHGTLELESVPGCGTTVRIKLPLPQGECLGLSGALELDPAREPPTPARA